MYLEKTEFQTKNVIEKYTGFETISKIYDILTEERKLLRWFTRGLSGKQFSLISRF